MNDLSLLRSPDAPVGGGGGGGGVGLPGRRQVSVQLRGGEQNQRDDAGLMDPANQSLADALRITFRLLQMSMVVLGVLYLLSGFQSIREGETGTRLLFGRPVADNLAPGFRFAFPQPFGELLRVRTTGEPVDVEDQFFPFIPAQDRGRPMDQIANMGSISLNPARDGSVITGDGNLAHTRWKITYSRVKPVAFLRNVNPGDEKDIVRTAVQRGVVQAIARVTIDDLLKQSADPENSISKRVRDIAQQALDRMESGIRLEQVTMTQAMAPLRLFREFSRVQTAESSAGKARAEAEAERSRTLNAVAGSAVPVLIELINRYERATELGDAAEQARVMETIQAVLENRPAEVDGKPVQVAAAGDVTKILSDARLYRASVVSSARAELELFRAKSEQFRTNPLVVVHRDWAEALKAFMGRDNVQAMWLPPGIGTLEMVLNSDPDLVRELQRAQRLQENIRAREERDERNRQQQFRTNTAPAAEQ